MSTGLTKRKLSGLLKQALAAFGLVLVAEGILVIYMWSLVGVRFNQLQVAKETRLQAQQTALHLQYFLHGDKSKLPILTEGMQNTRELLATLKAGGRWKKVEVVPASSILLLSLDKGTSAWNEYENHLQVLTVNQVWRDSTLTNNRELLEDSTYSEPLVIQVMDPKVAQARALVEGGWLRVSGLLAEFANDVTDSLAQRQQTFNLTIAAVVLVDLGLITLFYFRFRQRILERLRQLKKVVDERTAWQATHHDEIDELGEGLNTLTNQFHHASDFVLKIGEGNLGEKFNVDGAEKSKLAEALEGMQAKLKSINEEEQKRRWANEGLTKFVDILRSGNDNLHLLGDKIVSTLVQYTQSNQGGLYLVEEEHGTKFLELISLFAFNTKKFEQQKLKPGEGLVGQCYLEAETIFLTEIPQDYIRITSGLGDANPRSLLIVPLKIDKEIYGLVELASFQVYQPHEIAFVEKLGETIASTLSSVKTNQKTRKLLEDFQQQTEQMRAQEEEMRQNMEELTATQEEMTRKEQNYILKIRELEARKAEVVKGDDWQAATEMEKTLRIHLAALEVARKEQP